MSAVDMSPRAIDCRLRRVAQLRALCLRLGRAGVSRGRGTVAEDHASYNAVPRSILRHGTRRRSHGRTSGL
jgi:hypothetical protein